MTDKSYMSLLTAMLRQLPSVILVIFYGIVNALHMNCSNNPYGEFPEGKVVMVSMVEDPRSLDPVRIQDFDSMIVASNIHDSPYQYDYFARPMELIPSLAEDLPEIDQVSVDGRTMNRIQFSLKRGLYYSDDDCFAGGSGREIVIDDLIYTIKRTADSSIDPFALPLLSAIYGFPEFSSMVEQAGGLEALEDEEGQTMPSGIRKVDSHTIEILVDGPFTKVQYFFAMVSGSPLPRECVEFYDGENQPPFDRAGPASGPFQLQSWHPNHRMILERNPNYREEYFPEIPEAVIEREATEYSGSDGISSQAEDNRIRYADLAGQKLPFAEEIWISFIKAAPPRWTLFEQGYLDRLSVRRESFHQVVHDGKLTSEYRERGIKLDRAAELATFGWVFNLDDPLFKDNVDLRRAISLAINRDELIRRFLEGRAVKTNGIIPPGMEGHIDENRLTETDYDLNQQSPAGHNFYQYYDLQKARDYLQKAGYPEGRNPETGRRLEIHLVDVASSERASMYRYYIDQMAAIGIELKVEQMDFATLVDRRMNKEFQIAGWGWGADYPDPQNFFQLLYGPNTEGTYNEASFQNQNYDRLYEEMIQLEPGPQRQRIIDQMNIIINSEVPLALTFHRIAYGLSHAWLGPILPHPMSSNQFKYIYIDPELRSEKTAEWNHTPAILYILTLALIFIAAFLSAMRYRKNTNGTRK